ncbi:DUF6542 domain-containing protein [Corynebacterium sp.]|uniref:DUF6542 domain-containing protein n=1 Tax=Corynebacterium sp. TaxID=1720 RepID=UPI002647C904|nr:DUF6542 domain-containing protein [Corynebacterium sp.]MDN6137296.1 hypothetical protein [Corynebacterium sp.]MDN6737553.1 hypothetical protein [Corynebacterium sp.]
MSHANTQSHPVSSRAEKGFGALPVWTSIAVIMAALVTGLLISSITASVGWPFLICFILGAIAASLIVHVRGLFLTVASIPLLFSIAIFITSWVVSRASAGEGSPMLSATILVTSAYPLLQVFPHLAITLLGCIAIAVFRLYRAKQKATSISSKEMVNRRTMAESNRRNTQTTSRARKTTERLSVAELVERSKNNKRTPRPQSRPSTDSKTTSTESPNASTSSIGSASTGSASAGSAGRTAATRGASSGAPSRRGTASEVRWVRSTDASRRTARRDVSSRDGSSREYRHGDIAGRSGYASRTGRRVNEAQRNQERARRAQSDTRHATDGAVNAAGSDRTSRARPDARLRPDPRRRAGDVQKTVKRPTPPTDAPSKQAPAPDAADNRKRAPRALDEDLYGN